MTGFQELWIEQCEAALAIRERFGVHKALGYLIGEKLLAFFRTAEVDEEFAAELPAFTAEIRELFDPDEIRTYLDGLRRVGSHGHILDDEAYALARDAGMFREDVVRAAEDVLRMGKIRDTLLPD